MYLLNKQTGEFHVIIDRGYGLQIACGGLIHLCVNLLPQPPDVPLCFRCREILRRRPIKEGVHYVRSRNMLSNIATVTPENLIRSAGKPIKPLPGQIEMFE